MTFLATWPVRRRSAGSGTAIGLRPAVESRALTAPQPAPGVESARGWVVVGAGFFAMALTFGIAYSFGAFFAPMAREFHAGAAATSIIFSVHGIREIEEIMRCRLVMVTTSLNTHNAINIPVTLKDALTAYRDGCR